MLLDWVFVKENHIAMRQGLFNSTTFVDKSLMLCDQFKILFFCVLLYAYV